MIVIILVNENYIFASRLTKAPVSTSPLTNIHLILKHPHISVLRSLSVKPSPRAIGAAVVNTYHLI